jgi:hypothetical protein
MEIFLAFNLIALLIVFFVDAFRKRREFLLKRK